MDDLDLYTWLYEHYAAPQLKTIAAGHANAASLFADRLGLSQGNRLRLIDMVSEMRLHWGSEAFALGVQFGMELAAPRVPDGDCGRLLHFLPQLD